jgi:hypothetical protein
VEESSRREGHIGSAASSQRRPSHTPNSAISPTQSPNQTNPLLSRTRTFDTMASNGPQDTFAVPSVLAAMLTMRSSDTDKKKVAVDYLGRFQKSVRHLPPPTATRNTY